MKLMKVYLILYPLLVCVIKECKLKEDNMPSCFYLQISAGINGLCSCADCQKYSLG